MSREVSQDKEFSELQHLALFTPGNSDSGLCTSKTRRQTGDPRDAEGAFEQTCLLTTVTQHQLTETSSDCCAFAAVFHVQVLIRGTFDME